MHGIPQGHRRDALPGWGMVLEADGAFQGSALIGHSSGVEAAPSFIHGFAEREAPPSPLSQDRGVAAHSLCVFAESSQKSNAWSSLSCRSSRRVWSSEERPAVTRPSSWSSAGCGLRFGLGAARRRRRIKAQLAVKRASRAGQRRR
ncbi:hypothetical protein MRX96_041862 [Rhipicephalus microplus]